MWVVYAFMCTCVDLGITHFTWVWRHRSTPCVSLNLSPHFKNMIYYFGCVWVYLHAHAMTRVEARGWLVEISSLLPWRGYWYRVVGLGSKSLCPLRHLTSLSPPPSFLRQSFLLNPELTDLARIVDQWAPGNPSVSVVPGLGLHMPPYSAFCVF